MGMEGCRQIGEPRVPQVLAWCLSFVKDFSVRVDYVVTGDHLQTHMRHHRSWKFLSKASCGMWLPNFCTELVV
jgi:hypothetical protein